MINNGLVGTFCEDCRQPMCICDFKPQEPIVKAKPIHAKPSLYAFYFDVIKEIGLKYGYNIVLHGSMNRDLDLIAIPWQEKIGSKFGMLEEISNCLGGHILIETDEQRKEFREKYHGRECWVININRTVTAKYGGMVTKFLEYTDPQYYIDISKCFSLTHKYSLSLFSIRKSIS